MHRHVWNDGSPALLERYEVRGEIGRGGCAIVYEAVDRRLERLVALKVVKKDARDKQANARLAREARAGASIRHPNVCAVSDAGSLDGGRPYLVMERLHGTTLTQELAQRGSLPYEEVIDIAVQLLSALDAVHAAGVVHRDVKPDNVFLVTRTGLPPMVKLLDFGMCRRAAAPQLRDDVTLTRAGQVVGTPEYMSPEQVSGRRDFNPRIDLYAVGVILYEALSGHRAFPGKDAREIAVSVLMRALPPLRQIRPDLPAVLERIVSRAMDRDPNARYAFAADFQRDLLDVRAELRLRPDSRMRAPDAWPSESGARERDCWDAPTRRIAVKSTRRVSST